MFCFHLLHNLSFLAIQGTMRFLHFWSQFSSSALSTCPNHLSHKSLIQVDMVLIPSLFLDSADGIPCFKLVTHPSNHLHFCALKSMKIFLFHSAGFTTSITFLTQAIYNLTFILREKVQEDKKQSSSLNLSNPHLTSITELASAHNLY